MFVTFDCRTAFCQFLQINHVVIIKQHVQQLYA